ncbi:protein kinase C-binding protein NELL2 isoform X3 [Folsomia candida]|uniref:protein kinase C-binding protein NELL2 isoform X3 n=1 Tax=Folsomia candida TaxID=158441 RepID=UPI0016051CD1|nr:protein kinase C-binding protein NELL2 isoform X3 [Folsomia candida]
MFCIALVLLLQCLFGSCGYTFKVGGQEFVQVDLFDSLHLHNSTYQGVKLGKGVRSLGPGVVFSGDFRDVIISSEWVDRIRGHLEEVNDFTISASVKQNPNNVGTLLAFSRGLISALEIQSSGRKNELRVISNSIVEAFPFRLADGSWHRLAISFSASQVEILVDCRVVYRRVLRFDPASMIHNSQNISVWIGQKAPSNFLYQGVMQDLRLTFGPYGYLSQCPQVDTQCPTCSEYNALKMSFASLQSQIEMLTARLSVAEARLTNVEQCECKKSCKVNATSVVGDGSKWLQDCQECSCKKGEILCQHIQCPAINCTKPVTAPGECCPTCLETCYFRGRTYDHGEIESGINIPMPECTDCECIHGSMKCNKHDPDKICPPLSCPLSEQIVVPEKCCKVCPGTDYCATHKNQCHPNATCVNLQTTFTCQCNEGYSGDGLKSCQDLDECLLKRSHCARDSVCVNLDGSYDCKCIDGFRKLNKFQCEDADECADGSHKCHKQATCTNTRGSYVCTCNSQYEGNGFQCSPVCNRTCENGGFCIAPNVCSCRSGWTGDLCQMDVDECSSSSSSLPTGNQNINNNNNGNNQTMSGDSAEGAVCPKFAICVNKPGWHLCQCKEGYQLVLNQNGDAHCQDVNECEEDNVCSDGLTCINVEGTYECRCEEGNPQCSAGCIENDTVHQLGSKWMSEDCHVCTCVSPGTTSCVSDTSEFCSQHCSLKSGISSSTTTGGGHQCCSNCNNLNATLRYESHTKLKSCRHQVYSEIEYQSGDVWYSNCQTCECLNGETDCWSIDCPPANCHNAYLQPGDCCYRCPGEERNQDKCTHSHRNGTFSECHLLEETIQSGTRVTLPQNNCISCKCQVPLCAKLDGELCCSYDYDCVHKSETAFLTPSSNLRVTTTTTKTTTTGDSTTVSSITLGGSGNSSSRRL